MRNNKDNELRDYWIYKIINPIGKMYIGQTNNINRRYKEYERGHNPGGKSIILESIKKYGWKQHKFELVEHLIGNRDNSDKREEYWIEYFETWIEKYPNGIGMNLRKGGKSHSHDKDAIIKIIEAGKGRIKSKETIEKMINSQNASGMKEKFSKMYSGEKGFSAKLKNENVLDIIQRYNNGERVVDIAKIYNIDVTTIYYLLKGKGWKEFTHLIKHPNKDLVLREDIINIRNSFKKEKVKVICERYNIKEWTFRRIVNKQGKYANI